MDVVKDLDFLETFETVEEGIVLFLAVQQIPDVVCALVENNMAVYAVQGEVEVA